MLNESHDPHLTQPLTQEEQQLEKKWLELIYQTVPACLFLIAVEPDERYRFVSVNETFLTVTGLAREQVIGKCIEEVIPAPAHALVRGKYREALSENRTVGWEETSVYPAGKHIGEVHVTPMKDDATGQMYLVGAVRDITALREEAEALRLSEELFRTLLRSFPNGSISVFDKNLRYIIAEGTGLGQVNLTSNGLVGRTLHELFPQEMVDFVTPYYGRVFEGETVSFELPLNNQIYTITAAPLQNDAGEVYAALAVALNITQRKAAEEALRESEHRYRSIISNAPLVFFTVDRAGVFTLSEGKGLEAAGLRPEQLVGQSVFEIYGSIEVRERTGKVSTGSEVLRRVFAGETVRGMTQVSDTCFENSFIPMRDADGEVSGVMGVAFDITESKRAEDELRRSEERFRAMIEHGSDIISLHSAHGIMLYQSPSIKRNLGYEQDELIGQQVFDYIHPEDLHQAKKEFKKVRSSSGIHDAFEIRFRHKDGTWRWFECIGNNQLDNSAVGQIIFSSRNITARKQFEERLRTSETSFRSVVESIDQGLLITDLQDNVIYANPRLTRLTGYSLEEIQGKPAYQFLLPTKQLNGDLHNSKQRSLGAGGKSEHQIKRKDGNWFWAETNATPFRNGRGEITGTIGVITDITDRKQSERALRESEEQLRQSQKLESVGQLAGGIAHDFNNMLTAINGYSDLILRKLRADDPLRHKVEEIKKAGERAGALTYQLLAFSRKQILQPKTLNINEVVFDVAKMLQRLIGEDIDLKIILDERLGQVKTDPGQITQVIMNLVVNARDAMPSGGKLTIETDNIELDETYSSQHIAVKPGRYVMLAVSDTGIGIDPETQKRIFEPFFTTKEVGRGTGMGLATVYGIVKQSGGNIWLYSEVGRGSTFKIYLPRVDTEAESLEEESLEINLPIGAEKILLVEDEDAVRRLTKEILEMCGYEVMVASNGEDAIKLCEEDGCDFDLLVTDVVMPHMGGRELVKRLATTHPSLRVLFVSGYTNNAIVHHGVLDKGTNFIQKPFTPEALAKKVRDVLDAP